MLSLCLTRTITAVTEAQSKYLESTKYAVMGKITAPKTDPAETVLVNATVEFDKVLLVDTDGQVQVGMPTIEGAKVLYEIKIGRAHV